jgi:hypothetical protein
MGIVKNPPSWSHQSSRFERNSGTGFLLCPSVGPRTPKGILVLPAGGGGSTLRNIAHRRDAWSSVLFPAKPEKFDRPSTNGAASDPRAADARKFDVPNVRPPWATLGYKVFAGNTHDSRTLQTIVATMEARHGMLGCRQHGVAAPDRPALHHRRASPARTHAESYRPERPHDMSKTGTTRVTLKLASSKPQRTKRVTPSSSPCRGARRLIDAIAKSLLPRAPRQHRSLRSAPTPGRSSLPRLRAQGGGCPRSRPVLRHLTTSQHGRRAASAMST